MIYILGTVAAVIVTLVVLFILTYKVVDPNQAHVVVFMGRGRRIYAPIELNDKKQKTSYFYIPLLMKRFVLSLENVKMDISDIHLNDEHVAPFVCDVITWLHINDPILAAERLSLSQPFASLKEDLINIVQAVTRAVSMNKEILQIMKDRKEFSRLVTIEVGTELSKWGVELVNLEVNDIRDDESKGSTVIGDYETIRKVEVKTEARKEVAAKNSEAVTVEADKQKVAELAKAINEEEYVKRQIEKDQILGIAKQTQAMQVSIEEERANAQKVAAYDTMKVGQAEVDKKAAIEIAMGEAESNRIKGEKQAEVDKLKGDADASVIRVRGDAEGSAIAAKGNAAAEAKDKMAEAMKKYNDAATVIEKITAWEEVEKAKWNAYGHVAENAEIKIVNSGEGVDLFGLPLNAETGANIGQMIEAAGGIPDGLKKVVKKVIGDEEVAE